MKKLIFILFLLFLCIRVFAQIPEPVLLSLKGYGGNQGANIETHVTTTNDGGFIIGIGTSSDIGTGNIDSFCAITRNRDIFIKYNADASVMEWTKCYGRDGDSTLSFIFPTNDGGFVLGGTYNSSAGWGFLICKEDAIGNIIWSHSYSKGNSATPSDMIATNDGGYLMVGGCVFSDTNFTVHNPSSWLPDIAVIKLDSLGNKEWSKAIGGSEEDDAFSVIRGTDGGYYIFGATISNDFDCTGNHGQTDAYVVRLDSVGNIVWHHDLGGSNLDGQYGWAIADGKNGVLIATSSYSSDGDVHHHIGENDYWVLNIDSSNNIVWDNCFGSASNEIPNAICKSTDGTIWVAGASNQKGGEVDTGYGQGDAWIVHIDSVGNLINAQVLGSSAVDEGTMIYPLSNNTVITGGYYTNHDGSFASITHYALPFSSDAFLATFAPFNVAVKTINVSNDIKIYPNPAHELVTIVTGTDVNTIIITDVIGRKIYQTNFSSRISIDVKGWQHGMYYVQIVSSDEMPYVQKLLVE